MDPSVLAEQYVPFARSLAFRAIRRYSLAPSSHEDVISDAYLGLVKAARRADPELSFAPYAQRCIWGGILHGIRDRHGWRSVKHEKPVYVELVEEVPEEGNGYGCAVVEDPGPSPHEEAEASELWAEVDKLPERQRIALRLSYQANIPQVQLGELFGVSQMQACRYLQQGRRTLAEALAA